MTSIAERVPAERISREARDARPGVAAATALATVLVGAGWLAARLMTGLWLGAAWCFIAVREGWREGRSPEWAAHVAVRQQRRVRAGHPGPG